MEPLTLSELKAELERWPELSDFRIRVGPYQLVKDEDGNIYSRIEGGPRIVWFKGEFKE